ncbi:MAG: ATP-binding protein [Bacteroidetes bacterium]|nr:ATP-binding protein [Bacteroidota bacterium]
MEKKNSSVIRIALIGPESTAKSTLAEALAKYYNTVWVKEYSREYLSTLNRKYTLSDILTIAQQQLHQEKEALKNARSLLFADTELIISKVWCEDVFKTCPDWIMQQIPEYKYDLYLLTYPDLPWEHDAVRENPNRRMFFFDWYEKELKSIDAEYVIIKGEGDQRLENCITAIENFITHSKLKS